MQQLSLEGPLPLQVLSVLQFHTLRKPLLPNLTNLGLERIPGDSIPFIPLFLSTRTTKVLITFHDLDLHKVAAASMIATLPKLCPNLGQISLSCLPRDPIITFAVSELVLTANQNILQHFYVESPLTEEAREVIYKLPALLGLWTVVGGPHSLPTVELPNLTHIVIDYDHNHDWLQGFRQASLGRLAMVTVRPISESIGDFLGAFESVAVTTTIPVTLSTFEFITDRPWTPSYRSLLPFTQLTYLVVESSCKPSCTSTIDDDTIADLARAIPKLETLHLGGRPCETPAGVTVKGLAALAHYCPHLSDLVIHFQVASLDPPEIPRLAFDGEPATSQEVCTLKTLHVGKIRVQEGSMLMIVLTLLNVFPHLEGITSSDIGWEGVSEAISDSKQLARCSSKSIFICTSG